MTKVTNTTGQSLWVGGVELKPHATAEVADDKLSEAKQNKFIISCFASEKLALGDTAAKREADKKDKPHIEGTPAGSIRRRIEKERPTPMFGATPRRMTRRE